MKNNLMKNAAVFMSVIFVILFCANITSARSIKKKLVDAEEHYKKEDYEKALNTFIDVQLEMPDNVDIKYNIANVHYKMKNYEEAINLFFDVATNAYDINIEEMAYFNLGNSFYRDGKLLDAVEYYKKALELDPNDEEAKKNLEFVREVIKKMQNEQKEMHDKQEKERKDKEQQEEQEKQEQQEQKTAQHSDQQEEQEEQEEKTAQHEKQEEQRDAKQGEEEEQAAQAGEAGKESEQDSEKSSVMAKKEEMTKEEAERLLQSVDEDRKEFMKNQVQKGRGARASYGKDW
jgi:Ca-activated chloride channel family protein